MRGFIFLLLVFCTIANGAQAQQNTEHITVDGISRDFITYFPFTASKTDQLPVVISLHGNQGTPADQIRLADFRPLANQQKFILVCPAGIERSWNDGRPTKANTRSINDVKFIDALISYIITTYHADASRVYVTGMSNGGFMASRLACELNNRIAAVAVVAASMDAAVSYYPQKPIPIMYIQGTADPLVPFNGGTMKRGAGGDIYSHADALKKWAEADHCDGKPGVVTLPNAVNDGTTVMKEQYINPYNDVKVIGYTISNGGHTWPGGWEYMPRFVIGITTKNLNACQEIWDFFKDYRLRKN